MMLVKKCHNANMLVLCTMVILLI